MSEPRLTTDEEQAARHAWTITMAHTVIRMEEAISELRQRVLVIEERSAAPANGGEDDPICANPDLGPPPPPDPNQNPICVCGHDVRNHLWDGESREHCCLPCCRCPKFCPATPAPVAASEQAETVDPVPTVAERIQAIEDQAYFYGSFRYAQGVAIADRENVSQKTEAMVAQWDKLVAMLRELVL